MEIADCTGWGEAYSEKKRDPQSHELPLKWWSVRALLENEYFPSGPPFSKSTSDTSVKIKHFICLSAELLKPQFTSCFIWPYVYLLLHMTLIC